MRLTSLKIIVKDLKNKFLLLKDFGDKLYLNKLHQTTAESLYNDAITTLIRMQANVDCKSLNLTNFSYSFIKSQLDLFTNWYLDKHLNVAIEKSDLKFIDDLAIWFESFFDSLPQCFVHLDYHSRNLMVTEKNNPGVLGLSRCKDRSKCIRFSFIISRCLH